MAILIQNIFPEIEKRISGNPLLKNTVKQKVLFRFPIQGLGPDGFLAISQYKEEEICVLVAFTSKQKALFDRLKDQLKNQTAWIEEKGFTRIKDAPYRLIFSPSKTNYTSEVDAVESISKFITDAANALGPIMNNLLSKSEAMPVKTIYIHQLPHQELEKGQVKIPSRFHFLFPKSSQPIKVVVKNKGFDGSWKLPTNALGEGILEIDANAIKALEVILSGTLRIDLHEDGSYTITRLTDFNAVYECWLGLIKGPECQFNGYKTSRGNNSWFGISAFGPNQSKNYLPLHYEWIFDEDSFEFNIHFEKATNVSKEDFKKQIEIFKTIPFSKDWSSFKWERQEEAGRRYSTLQVLDGDNGPREIALAMLHDLETAFSHYNPYFQQRRELLTGVQNNHQPTNPMKTHPLNQILFGPPGTGKTYHTINKAVEILDPEFYTQNQDNRSALTSYFNDLLIKDLDKPEGQIGFITFHQSLSYEDFIEGIKPLKPEEDKSIQYDIEDGIFKKMALMAKSFQNVSATTSSLISEEEFDKATFFKISLGQKSQTEIYDYCIDNNVIAVGYGDSIDFSGVKDPKEIINRFRENGFDFKNRQDGPVAAVERFVLWPKIGDIFLVSNGNKRIRAIGQVTGDYFCNPESKIGYQQFRNVKWLMKDIDIPVGSVYGSNFMMSAIYGVYKNKIVKEFFVGNTGEYQKEWTSYLNEVKSGNRVEIKSEVQGVPYTLSVDAKDNLILTNGNGKDSKISKDIILKAFHEKEGSPLERLKRLMPNEPTHTSWPAAVLSDFEKFTKRVGNKPYVLIIDEINRGNVSQIFGELITLIEEDKRDGRPEALEVILPYSKEPFSVPPNLYIIGTMNTADRSVEALDTALRRRFVFEEKGPKTNLLSPARMFWKLLWDHKDIEWNVEPYYSKEKSMYDLFGEGSKNWEDRVSTWDDHFLKQGPNFENQGPLLADFFDPKGLNLENLLETINSRIEVLLSKDHQIGHSYFMKVYSEEDLKTAFYKSIIPLLQEYFYGDYGKIGLVLGKGFVRLKDLDRNDLFAPVDGYDAESLSEKQVYEILDYQKGKKHEIKFGKEVRPFDFMDAVRLITFKKKAEKPVIESESAGS